MKQLSTITVILTTTVILSLGCTSGGGSDRAQPISTDRLSQAKVVALYESITDGWGGVNGRSIDERIALLQETKTDMIFRGWWHWGVPTENDYSNLQNALFPIKTAMPNIIFTAAVPAQALWRTNYNPKKRQFINYPTTWNMALDPLAWGILGVSKTQFQCEYAKRRTWIDQSFDCAMYDPQAVGAYYPDITNPAFQELLLSWAEKLIDIGADAIWIDMLFSQANFIEKLTGDINHPAVKASYDAASKIIDDLHNYRQGLYVGTWSNWSAFPYSPPMLDFVTISPTKEEVLNKPITFNESSWNVFIESVKTKRGNIPIIGFIDWADIADTPLGAFSQTLSIADQNNFLEAADDFLITKGIRFAYPIHGGWMGDDATVLSYGRYKTYDSLAPEFQAYETIKELAQREKTMNAYSQK